MKNFLLTIFAGLFTVVVGWFLGILSTPLVHRIERRRDRRELGYALAEEFANITDHAVQAFWDLRSKHGTLRRPEMHWVAGKLENSANEGSRQIAGQLREQLKLTDEQFEVALQASRANTLDPSKPSISSFIPPMELPFLEAHLHKLTVFKPSKQQILLRIRAEVRTFNVYTEKSDRFHRLTFDTSSMTGSNVSVVHKNSHGLEERIASRAQAIVRLIERWQNDIGG